MTTQTQQSDSLITWIAIIATIICILHNTKLKETVRQYDYTLELTWQMIESNSTDLLDIVLEEQNKCDSLYNLCLQWKKY